MSPSLAGGFFTTKPPGKPQKCHYILEIHIKIFIVDISGFYFKNNMELEELVEIQIKQAWP